MRYFELLNFQHLMLAFFPAVLLIIIFGLALGVTHFRGDNGADRENRILYQYPDGIEDRDAPFPLAMILIVAGAVLWAFSYILFTGLSGVKI
jgi:hypothetical protein